MRTDIDNAIAVACCNNVAARSEQLRYGIDHAIHAANGNRIVAVRNVDGIAAARSNRNLVRARGAFRRPVNGNLIPHSVSNGDRDRIRSGTSGAVDRNLVSRAVSCVDRNNAASGNDRVDAVPGLYRHIAAARGNVVIPGTCRRYRARTVADLD